MNVVGIEYNNILFLPLGSTAAQKRKQQGCRQQKRGALKLVLFHGVNHILSN